MIYSGVGNPLLNDLKNLSTTIDNQIKLNGKYDNYTLALVADSYYKLKNSLLGSKYADLLKSS